VTSSYRVPDRYHGAVRSARRRRTPGGLVAAVAATTVLVVAVGGWSGYRLLSQPACGDQIRLPIAAASDIEPVVRARAEQWTATKPRVNGRCVAVTVAATDPADIAAAVAGQHQGTLTGVGRADGDVRMPKVWIPDSSIWLQRLRAVRQEWVPADAPSVARSPVVLAMPQPAAATLGWPNKKLTWADLLGKLSSGGRLKPGIVDPNRDAASLSGLLALGGAANAAGSKGQQAAVAGLRALATGRAALRADLLARFPRGGDVGSLASSLSAAPLSEQAVIAYNGGQPPVPLAPVYLEPAPVALDYPYTVLPGASRDEAAAAQAVLVTLTGDDYRDSLARQGLRASDGSTGAGFPDLKGAPVKASPAGPGPDPASVDKLLANWGTLTAPGRMLAVIDVSGSMATPVPTAGGATREQVAVEAARRGLGLLDDTWAVGLWIFSTKLDSGNDWQQLVPIGPLSGQRPNLLAGLDSVQTKTNGGTGLYNTVLAAYKAVQTTWDPGRVNSVVLFTDGKNEDAPGLTLDQLVAELTKIKDPARPVVVVALGIGNQVSEAELRRITDSINGATFLAPDPSQVGDTFLKALALRPTTTR
jgi:Ca-activated chloride channel homolog